MATSAMDLSVLTNINQAKMGITMQKVSSWSTSVKVTARMPPNVE